MARSKGNNPSSLSQHAYEMLLDRLLKHELVPGQIINRGTIANELGISIAPVLEAMVRMENEGLLVSIPRKGTQVRLIKTEEIADHLVVREALECQAARYYCGETVVRNEAMLKKLAADVDACRGGAIEAWTVEIAFHRALVDLAHCKGLARTYQQEMRLGTLCALSLIFDLHPEDSRAHHVELVDKLKVTDPDVAEKIIRDHLRGGKNYVFPSNPSQLAPATTTSA